MLYFEYQGFDGTSVVNHIIFGDEKRHYNTICKKDGKNYLKMVDIDMNGTDIWSVVFVPYFRNDTLELLYYAMLDVEQQY
jgi:hypothetical protein